MEQSRRKEWITEDTWQAIANRRTLKKKVVEVKSERLKERYKQCREANLTVKRMTRTENWSHINHLASQAEDAASRGEQGRVCKITKLVCGRYRGGTDAPIMDKQGRLLTTEAEQDARWDRTLQWSSEQTTTTNRGRYTRGRDRPGCQHRSPRKRRDHSSHQVPQERKIPWTRQSHCRSI